jgi:hypothetical protein
MFKFISDTDSFTLDTFNIKAIEIYNDYDENMRSSLTVNLMLDTKARMWLVDNWKTLKVYFEIQKFTTNDLNEDTSVPVIFYKGTFKVFDSDEYSMWSKELLEYRNKTSKVEQDEFNVFDELSTYETKLCLYDLDSVRKSMMPVDHIVTKDNLQNTIGWMLSKAEFKNVVISPFENATIYPEIYIPYYELYKSIAYLDNRYGFYKKGCILFFDLDTFYILNADKKCTAYDEDEIKYVDVKICESPNNAIDTMGQSETSYIIYASDMNTEYTNRVKYTSATTGEEMILINTDDGSKQTASFTVEEDNGVKEVRYTFGTTNKYRASNLQTRLSETRRTITFAGENWDVDAFKPNKEFRVSHTDQQKNEILKGSYRLSKVHFLFQHRGEDYGVMIGGTLKGEG